MKISSEMTCRMNVILCGTLFWAVLCSDNAKSAVFTVSGTGAGLSFPWADPPGESQSSTPGLSLDEYQDRFPNGVLQDARWIAVADAHSVGVFAEARTFQGTPEDVGIRTSATFRYDDLIFDSEDNINITVSLVLHYTGLVSARHVQGEGGQIAVASIHNRANLDEIGATNANDFNTSFPGLVQAACGGDCDSGEIITVNYDQDRVHTWNNVPTNTPLSLEVGLLAEAFVNSNSSQGGYATSDFSNTLTLASPGAVFTLPAGVTANSVEMNLANNVAVPEPSALLLAGFGVFGIFGYGRRHRRTA